MNFAQLKRFMKKVRFGLLATSDGKVVGVRPMAAWIWMGKEFWCAAEKGQEKIGQLSKVPYAEYCFIDAEGEHVRIAGPCRISISLKDKALLYDRVPSIHKFYDSPQDDALVILRMRPQKIRRLNRTTYEYEKIKTA